MKTMTAFDLLEKIRKENILKVIISSHNEYIYQSFAYHIFWYIQKQQLSKYFPIMMEKLIEQMEQNNQRIILNEGSVHINIPKEEIRYIEKQKNYLYIHANQTYKIRYSFKDFVVQFYDDDFVIPIYGTMVHIQNIRYVHSGRKHLILWDDTTLPISYTHKNNLLQRTNAYKMKRPNS